MSLFLQKYLSGNTEIGIWKIEEPIDFFLKEIDNHGEDLSKIEHIKGRRRLEWVATRYLLHLMLAKESHKGCYKDEFGKPQIKDADYHISISHSDEFVTVIISPSLVGIDVQHFVPKITRIAHKFMNDKEYKSLTIGSELQHMHVYWGAKESLYKAYGRKKLDLKKNILIQPFEFNLKGNKISGIITKDDYIKHFDLWYEFIRGYTFVFAREK